MDLFEKAGVDVKRITFRGPSPHPDMLAELADIDVALDPFPFSGGTTTVEMLWQGIPVITLQGTRFSQNMGVSYLHTLGLDDWITRDKKTYINRAVYCAKHIGELSTLRASLRDKMKASIICNGKLFSEQIEALYEQLWQTYIELKL